MAEAAVLAGVEWVVFPIITKVLNEGFSYLGETNIKDRLNNLETTILPKFQLVIEAAEKTEHKTKMGQWLRTLKDALCEAEDVLNLYKYQLLGEKVNDLNSNLTAKFYSKFVGNFSPQKIKLRRSLETLEEIAAGADEFRKLLNMENESSSATHDSSDGRQPDVTDSVPPLKGFGRGKVRDEIIDKYLLDTSEASESEKCYSVVAIVGIGGVGNTTLAQEVLNDKRLEKKFDIKMWVCVSRWLDVLGCTREMIECASKQTCPSSSPPPTRVSQDVLKSDLIDLIKSKKILLILDDVSCENSNEEEKWDNLLAPLAYAGKRGSRILVTTTTIRNLPQALHPQYSMDLLALLWSYQRLDYPLQRCFSSSQSIETLPESVAKSTMAEAIALSVAGWAASRIVTRLLNEGFTYLGDARIKDKLEYLETVILPQFYLVIEAAEKSSEHKNKLKLWLRKLKDAMYEAEDMLDLCKYRLIEEEKVHDLNSNSTPKVFGKFVGNLKRGLSSTISPQNKELRESLIKLERIAAEAKIFRELTGLHTGNSTSNDATSGRRPNVTTSLPPPHQVFGRDEERDEIINKYLLDASEASQSEMDRVMRKGYSVVAIVGIGGAGKTTLAQLVYNDPRVVDYFGIKMWVCLSRKLDVFSLTREMVESASNKKDCPLHTNLDALQKNLIDLIKSEKVLLVLDDVWCYESEDEAEWEKLLAPLSFGGTGSKILMTIRPENMRNMPVALRPLENEIKLKDLEEDEFLSLFSYRAFGGIKLSEPHKQEELEKIGKQIVQKLRKSPLAAKAVGDQLSKRLEANFWRSALNQDNLIDTQKVLIWSYQRLDGPLQRCFSFLSLFPKGQRFKEEEIVHLWMAEGFIDSSDDSKRIEDIGSEYFDELVSGSFLQLVEGTKYYGMHDLFHDLAEKVSKEDCLRIEDDKVVDIPSTIRHLYVSSEFMRKASKSFHKPRNLRTLIVFGRLSMSDSDLLSAAIDKFKKLRVLDLSWWSIKALPDSVSSLKYLRYLDLSGTDVVELPVSFDKLHHFQLLKLPRVTLPSSVANMFNLRHLDASPWSHVKLPYIGRLTSLQELRSFTVEKKNGHDIGQLKNLNELRGSLEIWGLENVGGKDKATEANLRYKKHLDALCLWWGRSYDDPNDCTYLDMEVLEGLEPPPNLTKLEISGCKSRRCPSWLAREGCLENLRSLSFYHTSFEDLPAISNLFLGCLKLWSLPNLRMLPLLPEGLKELVIRSCPLLVFVSEEELQKSEGIKKSITTIARSSQVSTAFKLTMEERQRKVVERGCLDVKKLLVAKSRD